MFSFCIKNQTFNGVTIKTALPEDLKAKGAEIVTQSDTINLGPGENLTVHFFVKFPKGIMGKGGTGTVPLDLIDPGSGAVKATEELHLVGPGAI